MMMINKILPKDFSIYNKIMVETRDKENNT